MRFREQFFTQNDCALSGRHITVEGLMLHTTGANNPRVSRYVRGNLEIGKNVGGNHWDRHGLDKCVHAFIGRFADEGVGTVQVLPWTLRGWHCGKGTLGSANNTHIGVEICEDDLTDPEYFAAVYMEAVELFAHLCKMFQLDPVKPGVILDHREGHAAGIASNHADVAHWFSRHGKAMDDFRTAVANALKGENDVIRYNSLAEIAQAAPWAVHTIRKLINKGYIAGSGKKDADGLPADLDLSMDMIRILVIQNKAGLFGK